METSYLALPLPFKSDKQQKLHKPSCIRKRQMQGSNEIVIGKFISAVMH